MHPDMLRPLVHPLMWQGLLDHLIRGEFHEYILKSWAGPVTSGIAWNQGLLLVVVIIPIIDFTHSIDAFIHK